MTAKPEPLVFELRCRRECYDIVGGNFIRVEERDAKIARTPAWFKPMRGNHGPVHQQAEHYNRLQTSKGYLDWFFFPEVVETAAA